MDQYGIHVYLAKELAALCINQTLDCDWNARLLARQIQEVFQALALKWKQVVFSTKPHSRSDDLSLGILVCRIQLVPRTLAAGQGIFVNCRYRFCGADESQNRIIWIFSGVYNVFVYVVIPDLEIGINYSKNFLNCTQRVVRATISNDLRKKQREFPSGQHEYQQPRR